MQAVEEAVEKAVKAQSDSDWQSELLSKRAAMMQAVEKAVESLSASDWKSELLSKKAWAMQAVEQAIEAQSVSPLNFDSAHQEQLQPELVRAVAMQPFCIGFGEPQAYMEQRQ